MTHPSPPGFGERYRMVRHIARGGMAQVYLARDIDLDRPVALKVLFPELSVDEAFVERFRREARAAANLSHPNIVSVYDWGQGDATYYIVMEFVDGETLSARIRRGPLDPDEAAEIAASVAGALAFAHRRNVIHRDVKPGNVLIDRAGTVKVTDFGIARAVGTAENLTQAGAVMGTATYFSPEQAQGHAVDARSDVYSLGVVLYEMLTGRPPFTADNPVGIAYKHVREQPDPPSEVNSSVAPDLQTVVLTALAKDPEDRYPDATALRADLERYLDGQPVHGVRRTTPPPPPPPTVIARRAADRPEDPTTIVATGPPSRRSRWWLALVVALIVALVAVGLLVARAAGVFSSTPKATIPAVAGQSAARAESSLAAVGLRNVTEQHRTDATVAAGLAIATDPAAGTRIPTSTQVVLEVSAGPPQVAVPDVDGQPLTTALHTLDAAGFNTTTSRTSSASVPNGDVVTTRPGGGSMQAKGIRIEVVVSSGKARVVVPSLTGDSPAVAGGELAALGLVVTSSQLQASTTVPQGNVTGTNPPANASVQIGSSVVVYISSGPPKVAVPSLTGDTRAQAAAALSGLGLTATFTMSPAPDPSEAGTVIATDPVAGTSVPVGTAVAVSIGSAPSTTTTTSTSTTTPGATTTTTSGT